MFSGSQIECAKAYFENNLKASANEIMKVTGVSQATAYRAIREVRMDMGMKTLGEKQKEERIIRDQEIVKLAKSMLKENPYTTCEDISKKTGYANGHISRVLRRNNVHTHLSVKEQKQREKAVCSVLRKHKCLRYKDIAEMFDYSEKTIYYIANKNKIKRGRWKRYRF